MNSLEAHSQIDWTDSDGDDNNNCITAVPQDPSCK